MGAAFEAIVSKQLLTAGQVEKRLAIEKGNYHNGVPAITVVVDAGWSKRSHKHSYNANSAVGVIPYSGYNLRGAIFVNHQISHLAVIFAIVKFANHCMYRHICVARSISALSLNYKRWL